MTPWPLFGLTIRTPRVELRYLDDALAGEAMALAATEGVHDPAYMPFLSPWTRLEPPRLQREGMQFFWRTRAELTPQSWMLPFGVSVDGTLAGVQDLKGVSFPVTGQVRTGSWLGRSRHGAGIGKEMRAAVLHLAFAGLGAQVAHTSAFEDNAPSIGVTRSLGYEANGWQLDDREGHAVRHLSFVLTRERWLERRRDDIEIEGLTDDVLDLLGIERVADA